MCEKGMCDEEEDNEEDIREDCKEGDEVVNE